MPVRPVRGVGLAASIAVGAVAVCSLLSLASTLVGRSLAERAAGTGDQDNLLVAALVEVATAVPFVVAYLAAIGLVIVWTYRARRNLDAFPGVLPGYSAGWAIAGWLVPFVNFVIPAQVMRDIAQSSLRRGGSGRLVALWWGSWLVFLVGGRWADRVSSREFDRLPESPTLRSEFYDYADHYTASFNRNLLPTLAGLVAGATLIVLIRRISAAQHARMRSGEPYGPVVPGMTVPSPE
ncbi:DUF4328 domain-containing protein [Micromonospora cathayae]|uniref:DUF4328 domain-containing protein n=1 Tax=Micromonospora cathayae TaxID=3028804 RepID=A0ABY7ZVA0_9ACTN|nr:DUF4328 domain-containing protein [Micromonospora sp. HUAS 3]WDZ86905.1 DUF4328 domain-containing protein [Micromonospora sp. HUAS 3]